MTARGPGRLPWRLRVLAVVVPAGVAMFAAIALLPDPQVDAEARVQSRADETQCLPISPVHDVRDLNALVGGVRDRGEFQGADVGADVTLQDGRRLWVFGDTLRARDFDGQRFVRNSMLVFSDECASVVLPADHGALIPDRSDGTGYWPMSIAKVTRTGYDLVGVAAQRVRSSAQPGDASAFTTYGSSIAVFVVQPGRTPQLIDQRDIGPDDPDRAHPTWGAAAAVHDGWVYLYGTANPDRPYVFGFSLQVARVRPDDILDTSRWTYWDGARWQRDEKQAAVLIPAAGGVSQTLSVFEKDGRWYALSKRDEFVGSDVVIWTAPGPTGPFTVSKVVARIPSDTATGTLRYMPLAHPELLPTANTVVVSYSQNNSDLAKVAANPFLYRPRFLRVALP